MSTKKFGIVAGIALALSVVASPVMGACSLTTLSECDNNGLMALIVQLLSGTGTSTGTGTGTAISGIPAGFQFTTNLKQGSTGNDVKYLQILLNSDAATSVGNAGNETSYFGTMTKAAVVKFQNKYASETLAPYGLSAGTGFFGTTSRAKANTLVGAGVGTGTGTGTGIPATGAYTVALAANQPSGTLASGSAYNTMLKVNISAGATAQSITSVTVARTGLSIDSNVDGVLVADEDGTRYGNVVTFANSAATIAFPSTPITVAAGETKTILIQYNLVAGALSGTIGTNLTAMSGTPAGLPLTGNIMSLADGSATLGGATVAVVSLTTTAVSKDVGSTGYDLTKLRITATANEDIYVKKLTMFQNGTAADGDITNIKLVAPDGTVLATVASSTSKYVTFDMTAAPYKIGKGVQKDLTVRVDVANGSSRTAQFIIQNNYDLVLSGVSTGMSILSTSTFPIGNILTGNAGYNGLLVASGTLTVSKDSTTPSGTIGIGAANTTLATWKFEGKGEDIELRSVRIKISGSGVAAGDFSGTVRLVAEDGTQIVQTSTTTTGLVAGAGATVSFSPYYTIPAGTSTKISLVVDTSSLMISTDQPIGNIATIYYKKVLTNAYATYSDATDIPGNTLTASQGTLSIVKNAALGNSTKVEGQSEVKIGSYLFQTNATEGVNVSSIALKLAASDTVLDGKVSNLKIKKSDGTLLGSSITTPSVGESTAYGSNNAITVSGELNIPANSTIQVDVFADIATGNTNGETLTSEIAIDAVSATGSVSGADATGPTVAQIGQIVVVSTGGALTVSEDTSGAASAQFLTTALAGVEMGRIKFSATVEDMKLDRLEVRTVNGSGNIAQVKLMGTGLATDPIAPLTAGTAVFTFPTGSEITVPAYGSKVLTVAVDTTNVGTITAGKLGIVGFGTANAKGAGSGTIVQESMGTVQTAGTADAAGAADFTKGDIVYFTATAAAGTYTAPGYYMFTGVTTADDLDLEATGIALNGGGTTTKFTAGDKVSVLSLTGGFTDNALLSLGTALAVGDVIYVHTVTGAATNDGFYVVGTAADATDDLTLSADILGLGGAMAAVTFVDTTTAETSDVITKVTNTNALVGNTMSFQEVEPVIVKDASSPSGSTSAGSDQIVAMFDIQAAGSRDLSFSDFTVEMGGSNTPSRFITHLSLYNGSSKIAEVADTSVAATSGAGGTAATTVLFNTAADATANHIGSVSAAEYAKWKVGDTLTFIDTAGTPVVSTARIVTLPAYADGVSVVFSGTITVTASQSVTIYNNRVHFNGTQVSTGDVLLAAQTVTAGQTMTLTVKADTSSVKSGVTGGASANLTMSVPGSAGPLVVDTGNPNGLTWAYSALNTTGTAHTGSTADAYPVAANTLSY